MTPISNMLRCHVFCTGGTVALFMLVFNVTGGTLGLSVCGVYAAVLAVTNPLLGFRTASSVPRRLAFVVLEIVNLVIIGFCLLPLVVARIPVEAVEGG